MMMTMNQVMMMDGNRNVDHHQKRNPIQSKIKLSKKKFHIFN
jgi:hypothetical protein